MGRLDIYTVQLAQWRTVKELGIPLIDVTAKSGNHVFAPYMNHVVDYKAGLMSKEEYIKEYTMKMRYSLINNPNEWRALLNYYSIALACYCGPGEFCHRHLLTDFIGKYATNQGYLVTMKGEIFKDGV